MYGTTSELGNFPPENKPTVTAGLMWHPEMCPIAYAIVSSVKPKASETPTRPTPTLGNPAASTAVPHPPRTSQNVPMNSAATRLDKLMLPSFGGFALFEHEPIIVLTQGRAKWRLLRNGSC